MPLITKIDGHDISTLVQASLESFDPANAFAEPQFAGNALSDGDLFIQMTNRNKEWTIPLIIAAAGTAYTNLLTNPRPYSVVTGWTTRGVGSTVTFNTLDSESVIQAVTTGSANSGLQHNFPGTAAQYSGGIWVKINTGTAAMHVSFDGYTGVAFTATTSWQFVKTEDVTLTAATRALCVTQDDAGSRTIYVKMAGAVLSTTYPGYFDGSFPSCIWNGTEHNSSSTQVTGPDGVAGEVRRINSHLKQGVTLEYREDGATASTYFDVEAARLDVEYRYQRNRQGVGKFVLKVWTRPFGHTGTTRVVATGKATSAVAIPIASLGLSGDAAAKIGITISNASTSATSFNFVAWGFSSDPNHIPHRSVASGIDVAGPAPRAVAVADAQSPHATVAGVGASAVGYFPLDPFMTTELLGKQLRLLVSIRSMAHASGAGSDSAAVASTFPAVARTVVGVNGITTYGPYTKIVGATGFGASVYNLYDLGQITVPSLSGVQVVSGISIEVYPTNVATVLATQYIRAEGVFLLENAGFMYSATSGDGPRSYEGASIAVSGLVIADPFGAVDAPVQIAGEMPALPPEASGGVFTLAVARRTKQRLTAAGRALDYEIFAREQFTFLR